MPSKRIESGKIGLIFDSQGRIREFAGKEKGGAQLLETAKDRQLILRKAEFFASGKTGIVMVCPFFKKTLDDRALEEMQRRQVCLFHAARKMGQEPLLIVKGAGELDEAKYRLKAYDIPCAVFFREGKIDPVALLLGGGARGRGYPDSVAGFARGFFERFSSFVLAGTGKWISEAKPALEKYLSFLGADKKVETDGYFVWRG